MKNLLRICRYLKPNASTVAAGLLFLFVTDSLQLVTPKFIQSAIDGLIDRSISPEGLLELGAIIVAMALAVGVFRFLWRQTLIRMSYKVERHLRNELYSHLQTLSMSYYDLAKTGDLMARSTNDISQVQRAAGIGLVIIADIIIMGAASIGFMLSIDAELCLIALIPLVLITLLVLRLDGSLRRRFKAVQESFSELTEKVRENLSGARVIKAFVQEEAEIEDFSKTSGKYMDKNLALANLWGLFFPMIMLFGGLGTALILYFGGASVIGGKISIGAFVAFNAYLGMLAWPMMAVGWVVNILQRGSVSMGRIGEILDTPPAIREPGIPAESKRLDGLIEFRSLSFAYSGESVLDDISIRINPGETVGIVGGVGAGKSTLINLLLRLYNPPPGTVFIDGTDIRDIPGAVLRKNLACVPQEPFLFSGSIDENVRFGNPGASKDEVAAAARAASIHDAVAGFPDGYETIVGERGVTLSGGEKQRVAIARALIMDAPVLILDDALSAVDTETESAILKSLSSAARKRTCLVISHRISAVENADRIVVLEGGKVAEYGSHRELAARGGWYSRMHRRQQVQKELGIDPAKKERRPEPEFAKEDYAEEAGSH